MAYHRNELPTLDELRRALEREYRKAGTPSGAVSRAKWDAMAKRMLDELEHGDNFTPRSYQKFAQRALHSLGVR